MATDAFGTTINLGDIVIYSSSAYGTQGYILGTVEKIIIGKKNWQGAGVEYVQIKAIRKTVNAFSLPDKLVRVMCCRVVLKESIVP